jgi:hypothetical protein
VEYRGWKLHTFTSPVGTNGSRWEGSVMLECGSRRIYLPGGPPYASTREDATKRALDLGRDRVDVELASGGCGADNLP